MLSAAFADDPVFAWLIPDRSERLRCLEPVFTVFAEGFARHDETHLAETGGVVHGAAMWAPPGAAPIHPDDERAFGERLAALVGPHTREESGHVRTPAAGAPQPHGP